MQGVNPVRAIRRLFFDRESLGVLLLLLVSVALFAVFKIGYLRTAQFHPERLPIIFICICLIGLGFLRIRYAPLHPAFSLLLRGISLSLGVYIATSWGGLGVASAVGDGGLSGPLKPEDMQA